MTLLVVVVGLAVVAALAVWGARVLHQLHELETLSARELGPPDEVVGEWNAADEDGGPPAAA